MVSTINIDNGIKEPTHGYQYCHISQILIFGGYVKVRSCVYPCYCLGQYHSPVILGRFYLGVKVLAWYIDPTGIKNKKYYQLPIPYWHQKQQNPHYRYPNGIKKNDTRPKLVCFSLFSCLRAFPKSKIHN